MPMPRVLRGSQGGGRFLMSEVPLSRSAHPLSSELAQDSQDPNLVLTFRQNKLTAIGTVRAPRVRIRGLLEIKDTHRP